MSTFLLVLLALLAILLAFEQALAAWASYHVKSSTGERSDRNSFNRTLPSGGAATHPTPHSRSRRTRRRTHVATMPIDTESVEVTK
jgi:hypothetical protein